MATAAPLRRLLAALTAALLLAALAAVGVAADDHLAEGCREIREAVEATEDTAAVDAVVVCESTAWFKSGGPTVAGNVNAEAFGEVATWDDEEPSASVTAGAGGGYATFRGGELFDRPGDPAYKPTFSGTVTGPVDNIAVDMYLFSPVYQPTGTPFPLLITLNIDGKMIRYIDDAEVDVPIEAGGDAAGLIRFAVTDIYRLFELRGIDTSPEAEHTVEASITALYWGDGNSALVWDTTEVPSSITFNPASVDEYTLVP